MAVLKTTSPVRSTGAQKLWPSKTVPSSKARTAGFKLGEASGIGGVTSISPHARDSAKLHNRAGARSRRAGVRERVGIRLRWNRTELLDRRTTAKHEDLKKQSLRLC